MTTCLGPFVGRCPLAVTRCAYVVRGRVSVMWVGHGDPMRRWGLTIQRPWRPSLRTRRAVRPGLWAWVVAVASVAA